MRLAALSILFLAASGASAQDHGHGTGHPPDHMQAHEMGHGGQRFYMYDGPATPSADYRRTSAGYSAPPVILRDQTGNPVDLAELLAEPRPVALQFIFTSCATICPVLSAAFAQAGDAMAELAPGTRLISISIDPEYDTPERLAAYAERYGAGENWLFLTGSLVDIQRVIAAFDALLVNDNKMYHRPYTFLRARPGDAWVRIEGLMSRRDMLAEFGRVLRERTAQVAP